MSDLMARAKMSPEEAEKFRKGLEGMVGGLNKTVLQEDEMEKAEKMVKESIPGLRKGSETPAYLHSFEVRDILARHGYAHEVCVAGLLHDVVEDGGVTFETLSEEFSKDIVDLVRLCSHDPSIEGGDARWVCMMANLVRANNTDAWAIKIADLMSNFDGSVTMAEDRRAFIRTVKTPALLSLTKRLLGETSVWQALQSKALMK